MRPWTIDADDIRIADDFEPLLLHRTPWIEDFLDPRDNKFIVVATKGFGKTLLLKAKRIAYQEASRWCIPQGSLLDKPVGDKVLRRETLTLYGESTQPWGKLWLTSIALAVLKALDMTQDLRVSRRLQVLAEDRNLHSVLDHFVNLLDFSRSDLYRCANDVDNQLIPRLRSLKHSVAVFIDSVDEYFNKHIQPDPRRSSDVGEISPEVWFLSQMALVEVAYGLRRISHHLKVFASVRKEAFARLTEQTAMAQQYRGSAVDISYSSRSLHEIFRKNVQSEKKRNLVARSRLDADPVEAFTGLGYVEDGFTREREDVLEYILRHTLLRPRDLMTIGQKLSAIPPQERVEEACFKAAVSAAASEIGHEYLREIEPYLGDVDVELLLSLIPGNVLTGSDIDAVIQRYAETDGLARGRRAIEALFNAGLLGCVELDPSTATKVQRFLTPGDVSLVREGALPVSTHYLIRPVLNGIISRSNPAYAAGIDRARVVGHQREWVDDDGANYEVQDLFVVFGDVRNFSQLMQKDNADRAARDAMKSAAEAHAGTCLYVEILNGDSIWIVDSDPNAVLKTANRIREEVFEAPGHPELRMAADYGPVQFRKETREETRLAGGEAVLRVARIEPRVVPSEIWATREFKEQLEQQPSLYGVVPIRPEAEEGGGSRHFNVRKPESDAHDMLVELFRVGLRA